MFPSTLVLAATSLTATAHGAALPGTESNEVVIQVPDLVPNLAAPSGGILEAQDVSVTANVDPAVRFTAYEDRQCGGWEVNYRSSDGGCFLLPAGHGLRIREIAATCRVFVYTSNNCDGAEFQAYAGNCYDMRSFYSIKTFCN